MQIVPLRMKPLKSFNDQVVWGFACIERLIEALNSQFILDGLNYQASDNFILLRGKIVKQYKARTRHSKNFTQ